MKKILIVLTTLGIVGIATISAQAATTESRSFRLSVTMPVTATVNAQQTTPKATEAKIQPTQETTRIEVVRNNKMVILETAVTK